MAGGRLRIVCGPTAAGKSALALELAATQTRERLVNARERLRDLEKAWECDHGCKISDLAEYYRIEDRRRVIRIELRRLRRDPATERTPPTMTARKKSRVRSVE